MVSPEGPEDIELLLEPNQNPAVETFQRAIYEQGVAAALFFVTDMQQEDEWLVALGVEFRGPPLASENGPTMALFDDTRGNLIQLVQS